MDHPIFEEFHNRGVIPVLEIDQVENAVPLAEALLAGGLPIAEVTLRTDAALDALRGWKFASPRGPIMIDPVTRDIVMNEYLSEVVMKDGRVYQKVIGKIDGVKDACEEQKIGPCVPAPK